MIKLGDPYFAPVRHEDGGTGVEYQGLVVGLIICRDDGIEFTIRDGESLEQIKKPLTWAELQTIPIGAKVIWVPDGDEYIVDRIFPGHGQLWLKRDSRPPFEAKYFEVIRVS